MKNLTIELTEFKCPLCHTSLASADYYRAIDELKKKVAETYGEEYKKAKQEHEQKLRQIDSSHKEKIVELKRDYDEKTKTLQKEMDDLYKKQLTDLKKTYEKINKDNQQQFSILEKKLRTEGKRELQEKEKQLAEMKKEQNRLKKLAFDEGKANADIEMAKLKNDVRERDIQIQRFQHEIDELKKKLVQSQSELTGEAGEKDLYFNLTQAFQEDFFTRQKRGTSMGDIVQRIRTAAGTIETPIVYDNKQADAVTNKDIEKAKKYKDVHMTDYVIIVSRNLPKKEVKNGLFGEKEGVLLCHPCIVVEVAKQIRRAVIEISKQSESKKDREAKESKLYDYIRSQEFASTVEKLHNVYQRMADLQDHEEKAHGKLWKERKKLQLQINDAYVGISNGVDCIIQEKLPMQELVERDEDQAEVEEKLKKALEPLITKRRKKAVKQIE
jgi:hypothetical protein